GVRVLRRQRGATEHCKQAKSWHNSYVSRTVNNLPPSRTAGTATFPRDCGKVPCKRAKSSFSNGFVTSCTGIQQFAIQIQTSSRGRPRLQSAHSAPEA